MKIEPRLSPANTDRRFYVTIPSYEALAADARARVDDGEPYPFTVSEHLPEHETFLDYLIDQSVEAWRRAAGGNR